MKQKIIIFLVSCIIGIGLAACSEDSDTPPIAPEKPRLEFRTSGTYDLSTYLFPTEESQINNYRDKIYLDDTGMHTYLDANESFYSITYDTNGSSTIESVHDTSKRQYESTSNRIKVNGVKVNSTMEYVRFLELQQYAAIVEKNVTIGSKIDSIKNICQITGHEDVRVVIGTNYPDVLVMKCIYSSTSHSMLAETPIETVIDTSYQAYLAKDIGLIESIHDSCTANTFGGLTEKKCKKIVTELTTYN